MCEKCVYKEKKIVMIQGKYVVVKVYYPPWQFDELESTEKEMTAAHVIGYHNYMKGKLKSDY
jgi:hypothetical protein